MKIANWKKVLIVAVVLIGLGSVSTAWAATTTDVFGNAANESAIKAAIFGSDSDPRIIAANLIRVVLGFLGLLAVGLVLYAGWMYMKSQGDSSKMENAKKILLSAGIGLIIILSAFAITTFIINSILNATGGSAGGGPGLPGGGPGFTTYNFHLTYSQPIPDEYNVFRDEQVELNFNYQINQALANNSYFSLTQVAEYHLSSFETVISSTTNFTALSNPIDILISTSSNLTMVKLRASSSCVVTTSSGTTTKPNCLPSWSKFHVKIDSAFASLAGLTIDCSGSNYCEFDFYTNDSFGDGRPVIRSLTPVGGFCVNDINLPCLIDADCGAGNSCDVFTPNAKPGNLVSISGRNFGTSSGSVGFFDSLSASWFIADLASAVNSNCQGWGDTEVVVVLPSGLAVSATSSVQLKRVDGQEDYNNDKFGPLIKDLLVNDIERPGICKLSPSNGRYGDVFDYHGLKLLAGESYLGSLQSKATTTSGLCTDLLCPAVTPNINTGTTTAFVLRGNVFSNFLAFHKDLEAYNGPYVSKFEPITGPKGQYVTIFGSGFGYADADQLGLGNGSSSHIAIFAKTSLSQADVASAIEQAVISNQALYLVNPDAFEANYDFPPICSDGVWADKQIIVKVPDQIDDSVKDYYVYLAFPDPKTAGVGWLISSANISSTIVQKHFVADANAPLLPGICAIKPAAGNVDAKIDIYGEHFPSASIDQNIYFTNSVKALLDGWLGYDSSYKADHATASVSFGAISGAVHIKLNSGLSSNPIGFLVGDCQDNSQCGSGSFCCQKGSPYSGRCMAGGSEQVACFSNILSSVFAWSFGTYLSTSTESCSGFSNANACMLSETCPNAPGSCQSQEKSKSVGVDCSDGFCQATYAQYCSFYPGGCKYYEPQNYCGGYNNSSDLSPDDCNTKDDSLVLETGQIVEAYCNEVVIGTNASAGTTSSAFYWQYKPGLGSCDLGSKMALGGWCTVFDSLSGSRVCDSCQPGFKCVADRCLIGGDLCPSNTSCQAVGSAHECLEDFTCECCCQTGNDEQDCCAGLTCTPKMCVNSATSTVAATAVNPDGYIYGQCTGCKKYFPATSIVDQAGSDLACSCNGANRYCNVEPQVYINGQWLDNPTGICDDMAKVGEACHATNNSTYYSSSSSSQVGVLSNKPQYAYWRLDAVPNSLLLDSIGNISSSTSAISTTTQLKSAGCLHGYCLSFDGSQEVTLGDVSNAILSGDQTWSVWFKPGATTSADLAILKTDNFALAFTTDSRIKASVIDSTSAVYSLTSTSTYPLNDWIHVVLAVANNKSLLLAINNTDQSFFDFAGRNIRPATANNVVLIDYFAGSALKGLADEVQFYNQALDLPSIVSQTNNFDLIFPVTYNSTTSTTTTSKINQGLADGLSALYWQSDSLAAGTFIDYNSKYTVGEQPKTCTVGATSSEIFSGHLAYCQAVDAFTAYWQVKKPSYGPCPGGTFLTASNITTFYPWCTIGKKPATCQLLGLSTTSIPGFVFSGTAQCNLISYGMDENNQTGFCSANLPVCASNLQCDPRSCTCQLETFSSDTSSVRSGEPCTKPSMCDVGVPSCDFESTSLHCLNDNTGADCRCCCDPTIPETRTVYDYRGNASLLTCLENKSPCSGSSRGLFCGCTDDNQCNNGVDGCGIDTCCHSRAAATSTYPYNNATDVCRNTQISITFNENMDPSSFTGNIFLVGDYGSELCPDGTVYLTTIEKKTRFAWLKRLVARVAAVFTGDNRAFALGNNYCAIEGRVSAAEGNSSLIFSPLRLLDPAKTYFVSVMGDASSTDSVREGVLNYLGVGIHDEGLVPGHTVSFPYASSSLDINGRLYFGYSWHFMTQASTSVNNGVCLLDKVRVSTKDDSASWIFTSSIDNPIDNNNDASFDTDDKDYDKLLTGQALSLNDQLIAPIPSIYDWSWSWSSQNSNVVSLRNYPWLADNQKMAFVNKKQDDAQAVVSATVEITDDVITQPSTIGQKKTGKASFRIFICNNPWPPVIDPANWPWEDSGSGCTSGVCTNNNFEFYYCRDAGNPGTYDDLPVISTDPVKIGQGSGYCSAGYSYNKSCMTSIDCSVPASGTPACIAGVCGGGLDNFGNTWPNPGGKCFTDSDCWQSGSCKIVLKEFFFGRDSIPLSITTSLVGTSYDEAAGLYWLAGTNDYGYKIYYSNDVNQYSNSLLVGTSTCDIVSGICSYTFSNLINDKDYYFAFVSLNNNNTESPMSDKVKVKPQDTIAPAIPANASTSDLTPTSATIVWDKNTDDTMAYRVYIGTNITSFGKYFQTAKTVGNYTLTGLTPGGIYYYKVTAIDEVLNESLATTYSFIAPN